MANPIYFIEHQGLRARYFLEVDRDENSREAVIGLIRTREADPVKVIEVDEAAGTVRDCTAELINEAFDRVPA